MQGLNVCYASFVCGAAMDEEGASSSSKGAGNPQFWESERAWQDQVLKEHFELSVSDPQTKSQTFGKSYTTYKIVLERDAGVSELRRRFSDFDWLRQILRYRFHGIAVPCLPPKKIVGNQNNTFIEERRQGLEKWLREIAGNPYLRKDSTFYMFLTTPDATEFEQAKKAADNGAGADPNENKGLARWFGVLQKYPLPQEYTAAVDEVERECNSSKEILERAVRACNDYFKAAQSLNDALTNMRETFEMWRSSSESSSSPVPAAATATGELTEVLSNTEKAFSEAADLAGFSPNEIKMFLMTSFNNELRRVNAMRDLLDLLKSARSAYEDAFGKVDSLKFKEKQLRSKGKMEQADALSPKIAEAEEMRKKAKDRVEDITKGILNVEAAKVCRARVQNLTSTFGQFAALNMASGERTQTLWQTLMSDLQLDSEAMVARAQSTLTGDGLSETDGGLPGPPSGTSSGGAAASSSTKRDSDGSEEASAPTFTGTSYSGQQSAKGADDNDDDEGEDSHQAAFD
eukprot:gb/GECG01014739.1/.p1 GENE.gb/GECG01014739.1/~~gb/GECG01014739.1/.p1  ORF type:complete len:517 (+),score=91.25 gb/GECG01014739.1/:1-1551(+)